MSELYENPFNGEKKTASEWAHEKGVSTSGFQWRVREWGLEDERTWHTAEEARLERGKRIAQGKTALYREGEGGNEEYHALGTRVRRVRLKELGSWEKAELLKEKQKEEQRNDQKTRSRNEG